MGDITFPGHVPQPQRKLVIEITIGENMTTPQQVREAVFDAMWRHSKESLANQRTSFDVLQFPPHGDVRDEYDHKVGEWRITS